MTATVRNTEALDGTSKAGWERADFVTPADKPPQRLFVPGADRRASGDAGGAGCADDRSPQRGAGVAFREVQRAAAGAVSYGGAGLHGRGVGFRFTGGGYPERCGRAGDQFVNGAFSQRWHDVSVGCGKEAIAVEVPWCTAVKPERVEEALQGALADGPVDAITVVHNETSTGVASPIDAIAACVRRVSPETLVLVDAVSSFSGVKLPFDEWGLDMLLTSSQKALAVPPGLAFAAVSDRLMERAASVANRGWYFDFCSWTSTGCGARLQLLQPFLCCGR